jgi:hypothetical protein
MGQSAAQADPENRTSWRTNWNANRSLGALRREPRPPSAGSPVGTPRFIARSPQNVAAEAEFLHTFNPEMQKEEKTGLP